MSASDPASASSEGEPSLEAWQVAVVDLFVHAVQVLGLPKSLGQIYGLLYTLEEPLTMDGIARRLAISLGSTSQGLRLLRQFGAVRTLFVVGNRREHFVAEKSLRRFGSGFITEILEPHLASGKARLTHLENLIAELPADHPEREQAQECQKSLQAWLQKAQQMLPILKNFL